MIAIWALLAFIGTIVVWNAVLGRNIGTAQSGGKIRFGRVEAASRRRQ